MARILLLTNTQGASVEVLPSLSLLQHQVQISSLNSTSVLSTIDIDIVFIDGRRDIATAKSITKIIDSSNLGFSTILIATEGALSAVSGDWGFDDVILDTAGPAEVEARIRICLNRKAIQNLNSNSSLSEIKSGEITIDESSYTAKLKGKPLDLTFKEFELLKFFMQHPGRVFTRSQLLQEIWGYDYFGGTRTVDVHIRRLRSKLGSEFESVIGTVRNVGYRYSSNESQSELI